MVPKDLLPLRAEFQRADCKRKRLHDQARAATKEVHEVKRRLCAKMLELKVDCIDLVDGRTVTIETRAEVK